MAARKSTGQSRRTASSKKTTKKRKVAKKTTSRVGAAKKKTARKKTTARKKPTTRKKVAKTSARKKSATGKVSRKKTLTISSGPSTARDGVVGGRVSATTFQGHGPASVAAPSVHGKSGRSTRFAFVGSGECGGRLVESFYRLGYDNVLALDTSDRDLDSLALPTDQRVLMDIGSQDAGGDMSRGRGATLQYQENITDAVRDLFDDDVDHLILTFGCGGGTGGGSAMPLVETLLACAREAGCQDPHKKVGVLCTLPTSLDARSPDVGSNAARVLARLTQFAGGRHISPLIVVDNEQVSRRYPNSAATNSTINDTITSLFDDLNRLSAQSPPESTFDALHFQGVLQCGGCCIMGMAKLDDDRFSLFDAMRSNLTRSLLASGFQLETASEVGAIVVGNRSMMNATPAFRDRINNAFTVLGDIAGDVPVHRGVLEVDAPGVRLYTIFGGLEPPAGRIDELQQAA